MKRFLKQSSTGRESETLAFFTSTFRKSSSGKKKFTIFSEESGKPSAPKRPFLDYGRDDSIVRDAVLSSTSIHNLPAELLEYTFSFLDFKQRIRIEKVCKRWRVMGKQMPWTCLGHLGIKLRNDISFRHALTALLSRCGEHLKQLEINTTQNTWPTFALLRFVFNSISQLCPNLQEITFSGIQLSDHNLKTMGFGCRYLKVLRMKESCNYTDEGLSALLEICDRLECLEVYRMVSAKCFCNISRNIKSLQFKCCDYKVALSHIMNKCEGLRELNLGYVFGLLDVNTFKIFLNKYKSTINALWLGPVRYTDWDDFLQNLSKIQVLCLRLGWNNGLSNTVFKNCTNLTNIYLSSWNITDVGLMSLKALPALKGIDVSCCLHLNGTGIKALAVRGLLEEVYAMNTSMPEECFLKIAQCCPNIRILNVSYNKNISNGLIDTFREYKLQGVLKNTVKLFVCSTSVSEEFKVCKGLEVKFDVPKMFFGFLPFNPHWRNDVHFARI